MDKACQVSYWYSTQQCFLKIWFICTFSYPPRDVGFLTGGKCASLLHWNLTIPPSLWPDRELRKYHCPCLALHRRRLQSGICFCETAIAPMGFMACSRRLDQTGMYLKNEYSVFKGHPDFRPHKISLTRILRFRVGLVGALWLSLQDYIRFVLIFSVLCAAWLGQKKKYPVGFPTRYQRL